MNNKDTTIQIIVATHKAYRMPQDPLYLPLQVGAAGKESIGYRRDDTGDNISEWNPWFCELTGLYWAWKNLDKDYLGLVHYRRYFAMSPYGKDPWDCILTGEQIAPYLGKIRMFVPVKRKYYIETLYSHYAHTHYASQLDAARAILAENHPDDLPVYDRVVKRRWGYMFNMMITTRELFSDYCAWLFSVLPELRKQIGTKQESELDQYQGRFYGRVSEILFNVWLEKKRMDRQIKKDEIMELPFVYMEKINWQKKGIAFLRAKFTGKRYQGSF